MIRPILNARLDGASTIPATGTLTAASGSTVDLSLATVTLPASITSTFFDFKGNQSASGNPNYPAGAKGDVYYISVAGKVGGASGKTVTVGDMLICSADNAGGTEASIGTSWFVTESNLDMTNVAITGGSITGITDITVADGGTGRSTGTTAYALIATGTTATGAQQTLASGATTEVLVGGGASALPVWTTATGTGAPVRATAPTMTLTNATALPLTTGVTGTLPVANGGTGADSLQSQTFALLREEFASGGNTDQQVGNLGWRLGSVGGTGGSGGFTASTASHPGQYTLTTASAYAASVSDCYGIWLGPGSVAPMSLLDAQEIRFTFTMASTANVKVKIGMTNDQTVYASNRGEYIGFDTSLSETNFMGVTKDGGAETRTSTGVAAGTGWFTVKIRYISSTSIGFSVSSAGGAFSSETVIAQTAGGGGRFPLVFIGNNAAAAKSITVDFFSYYLPSITR